jgi:type IV secretory pathway VirB10-like protein
LTLAVAAATGCAKQKARSPEHTVDDVRRALLAALVASRSPTVEQAAMASPSQGPPARTANPPVTDATAEVPSAAPGPASVPPVPPESASAATIVEPAPEPTAAAAAAPSPPGTDVTIEEAETPPAATEPTPEETERAERARKLEEMKARAIAYFQQPASLYGAGSGFTGVGAGEGYTGVGAGEGYTGIGAGEGYTGIGAEEEGAQSAVAPPGVLLVPVRPWLPYPPP